MVALLASMINYGSPMVILVITINVLALTLFAQVVQTKYS
jgi:hypothetical protein